MGVDQLQRSFIFRGFSVFHRSKASNGSGNANLVANTSKRSHYFILSKDIDTVTFSVDIFIEVAGASIGSGGGNRGDKGRFGSHPVERFALNVGAFYNIF